ncbi:hypothetical protein GW17_00055839, partial [Ensete ventricosum]
EERKKMRLATGVRRWLRTVGASTMSSADVAVDGDSGRGWVAIGKGGRKTVATIRQGLRQWESVARR